MDKRISLFPRVFVYGTLKNSFPAHHMLQGTEYLGECFLVGFAMRHHGRYPAALQTNQTDQKILGEVYELVGEHGKEVLKNLDAYEGVSSGHYKRIEYETAMYGKVWVYVQDVPAYSYSWIPDGIWKGSLSTSVTVVGGGVPARQHSTMMQSQQTGNVSDFPKTTTSTVVTAPAVQKPPYESPVYMIYEKPEQAKGV